jgi:charged multivesicular body protein 6
MFNFLVNFSRAKLLLRKKKFQEGLLQKTDGQLDNLERLVHDLEFAQIEKQVHINIFL